MEITQYTLSYINSKNERKFILSSCEIIDFSVKCLYSSEKSAERAFKKLLKILPIRVANLERFKNVPGEWQDAYYRDLEAMENVQIYPISIDIG